MGKRKNVEILVSSKKKNHKKKGGSKKKGPKGVISIKGHGDYSLGNVVKHGASLLGDAANHVMATIMGQGDYEVKQNSLMIGGQGPPQFKGNRRVTITHREYITDILTAANTTNNSPFNLQQFEINPATSSLFPWLSSLAENFEQFKLKGMVFEYKTMSANALTSTNTALGQVIMATQYNSLDAPFQDKREMEQYEFATSTVPSCSALHPVECDPARTVLPDLYIENDGVAIGDPRFSYFGTFNIATVGFQSNVPVNIGELWVSYDIEFSKPRLSSPFGETRGFLVLNTHRATTVNLNSFPDMFFDKAAYPGEIIYDPANGLNIKAGSVGNSIAFDSTQDGLFEVTWSYQYAGSVPGIPTPTVGNGAVLANQYLAGNGPNLPPSVPGGFLGLSMAVDNVNPFIQTFRACVYIPPGTSAINPPYLALSAVNYDVNYLMLKITKLPVFNSLFPPF